jgi:membrane protease YdiL (CAAX protease family)
MELLIKYILLYQQIKTRTFVLIIPLLLTLSCGFVFWLCSLYFSKPAAHIMGFLFYWMFWCVLVPLQTVGWEGIKGMFSACKPHWNVAVILCLVLPLVLAYSYAFPRALSNASPVIVVVSLIMAIVNATLEEVLWRGVYIKCFNDNKWIAIVYASAGFAIWHYCPQIIYRNPNPGGAHSFVAFAFILGLLYAFAAYKQQSIFWVTISHVLFDFSGLGARLYF